MSQLTLYLDPETEAKLRAAAEASGLSLSRWVAGLIQEKAASEWPESVASLAGAWKEAPLARQIRAPAGRDVPRESF